MKQKIFELRWNLEKKALQHLVGAALFSVFVLFDYWADKFEALVELLEEFLEEWIHIDYHVSEDIAIIILLYTLVLMVDRFVKFGITKIAKLFKKKQPNQTTEVSE